MLHSQNFSTVYADIHVEACRYQLNCSKDFLKTDKNKTKISCYQKIIDTKLGFELRFRRLQRKFPTDQTN